MNAPLISDIELQRMQAAADWLVRLSDAPGDEALVTQWFQWCQEHADNLPAFKRAQAVWEAAAPDVTEGQAESQAARTSGSRHSRLGRPLAWAAVLVLAIGTGLWVFAGKGSDSGAQSYSTPVAGLGSSVLPDGSRVELGASSHITTHYTAHRRSVSVDAGEAFFKVTKDSARPFVVTAHGVMVTAIGTEFNVRHASDRIVVTVREGKVRVVDADSTLQPVSLEAGGQAVFLIPSRRVAVAAVPPSDAASWREGVLKYENEPLSSVVADLSRYSSEPIVVSDPEIARRPFTGTIFSTQIPQALRALEDVFPLRVVRHAEAISLEPAPR